MRITLLPELLGTLVPNRHSKLSETNPNNVKKYFRVVGFKEKFRIQNRFLYYLCIASIDS
jgi:hypothetical protein